MAGEKILSSLWLALALVGMLHGTHGAYRVVASQENVFHHGLKIVHPAERTEQYGPASQEVTGTGFHHQQQHPAAGDHQQFPQSAETHHVYFQPQQEQQYLVQSGYNVQPEQVVHRHEEAETQQSQQQQLKQRLTALPCNHERLHVKIDYPGAGRGIARPTATHPTVHEPQPQQQDYRSAIPKSIAPKLNPLHHSFHQNRNFVPLHHITRQVPVPAGRHGQAHPHSQQQPHPHQHQQPPVKAALAAPPPQHIAG